MEKIEETFEEKLAKIDTLIEKLNDENLNLKQSVEFYKNGAELIKQAREILENAKLEVRKIETLDEK